MEGMTDGEGRGVSLNIWYKGTKAERPELERKRERAERQVTHYQIGPSQERERAR
mgnify:CR=1 FL=1